MFCFRVEQLYQKAFTVHKFYGNQISKLSLFSPGTTERAEYHVMSHPQTFPRGLAPDYRGVAVGTTLGRRSKNLFTPRVFQTLSRPLHKATAVFGHAGGRLVVPNTGEPTVRQFDLIRSQRGGLKLGFILRITVNNMK